MSDQKEIERRAEAYAFLTQLLVEGFDGEWVCRFEELLKYDSYGDGHYGETGRVAIILSFALEKYKEVLKDLAEQS